MGVLKTAGRGALIFAGLKIASKIIKGNTETAINRGKIRIDWSNAKYIPTQVVIWKRPDVPKEVYERWKKENLSRLGVRPKKLCDGCDDSLELWEGDNVATFISERVAKSGTSQTNVPPSGGGDDIAYFSYNLIIEFPEPGFELCRQEQHLKDVRVPPQPVPADPAVTVAVFDTGVLPSIKNEYTLAVPSCMPTGDKGWNFAYKNNVTTDDYPKLHGSAVSKFIIDQAVRYSKQKINILPVKVHNNNGKSDLFSILCGFAYASNCGAQIINASFGFYASKGSSAAPLILYDFVKRYLTDKQILLIAAAGNVNADETVGLSNPDSVRNLDSNPFFPANLAGMLNNVFAVTTVSLNDMNVSPTQNYSKNIVDIGVQCDSTMGGDYRFKDSLDRQILILGSSYATPIVTGIIAQHYHKLMAAMPGGKINKTLFLDEMARLGLINREGGLAGLIRSGNYSKKE